MMKYGITYYNVYEAMCKAHSYLMKKIIFVLTALMVILALFFMTGTAYSMEKGEKADKAMEVYYRSIEKDFETRVVDILNSNGYRNAGVMLNCSFRDNGSREYTLSIHHKKLQGKTVNSLPLELIQSELDIENSQVIIKIN